MKKQNLFDILMNNKDSEELFEQWYEDQKDSDNFEENVWYHQDDEIEEYRIDNNLEEDSDELNKWIKEELKNKARNWFDDRWDDLVENMWDFDYGNTIRIYRMITVDNVDLFINNLKQGKYLKRFKGLGIFWSWDKNKAEAHWSEGSTELLIEADINVQSIDIESSLLKNFNHSLGLEEAEIEVFAQSDIFVSNVTDVKNNISYEINQTLLT